MRSGLLLRLMWCGLLVSNSNSILRKTPDETRGSDRLSVKAQGSARYLGNNSESDIVALTAQGKPKPDCELLGYKVDEDPRWNFDTAPLASCECWPHIALLKCKVVIPNDHIFDETNIERDIEHCGRSVYNAVPRWPTAKSQPRCELDREKTAHLTWKNGIAASMKNIKKGFDIGTCGQFKDVQCNRVNKPST